MLMYLFVAFITMLLASAFITLGAVILKSRFRDGVDTMFACILIAFGMVCILPFIVCIKEALCQ